MKYRNTLIACTVLLLCLYTVINAFRQPQIKVNDGLGWDGVYYFSFYNFFSGKGSYDMNQRVDARFRVYNADRSKNFTSGDIIKTGTPYNQRPAVPLLASILPLQPATAFLLINIMSFCIGLWLLLLFWIKKYPDRLLYCLLAIVWIAFALFAPVRFSFFYPYSNDGPVFLFMVLLLRIMEYKKPFAGLCCLFIIFLFAKETPLVVSLCFVFFALCTDISASLQQKKLLISRRTLQYIALCCFVFILFYVLQGYFSRSYGFVYKSGFKVVKQWVAGRLHDPAFFLRYIGALIMVYGLFFTDLLKRSFWVNVKTDILLFLTVALLLFSAVAGSDLTKFLFYWTPLVFTYLLANAKKEDSLYYLLCFILSLPLARPFAVIPGPIDIYSAAPTYKDTEGFFSWLAEYGHIGISIACVIYALLMYMVLRWFFKMDLYIHTNDQL